MDVSFEPRHDDLREAVRRLIRDEAPQMKILSGSRSPELPEDAQELRRWSAALYRERFLGQWWPQEWGGVPDWDPLDAYVISEELARAHVPKGWGFAPMAAHGVIAFGTEQQKEELLPRIRTSEHIWCQLFSEPGAGSDLAGLRTIARREGDAYIVSGQKVWNTHAHWADRGLLLVRTDPDGQKHHNLSLFALDMSLPGVTVRPLREITGTHDFNEVFFDDVVVPAEAMIGAENNGWAVARSILAHERGGIGEYTVLLEELLERLVSLVHGAPASSLSTAANQEVRQRLGGFAARIAAGKAAGYRRLTRAARGVPDSAAGPLGKLVFSELNLELIEYGLQLLGEAALYLDGDPQAVDGGRWQDDFLYARAYTIGGGTSDIMRNLLAERALGMPKDPVRT